MDDDVFTEKSEVKGGVHDCLSSRRRWRIGAESIEIPLFFDFHTYIYICIYIAFFPVLSGTHHSFYGVLRVDLFHTAAHLGRSSFVARRILNRLSFLVAKTTDGFFCRLLVCCLVNPGATLHTSHGASSCTRGATRLQG